MFRYSPLLLLCLACLACRGGGEGGLSTAQLTHAVDQNRPSLKVCYEAALKSHPYENEVRMQAIIAIAPSGVVSAVDFEDDGLPGMTRCVRAAVLKWKFPQAKTDTRTQLPIVFQPEVKHVLPEGALVPGVELVK